LLPPRHPLPSRTARGRLGARVALLALCVGLGVVIGFVGRHFAASEAWFLAIPACVVVGWLLVADPTTCETTDRSRRDREPVR
jgi:hypothetical protein